MRKIKYIVIILVIMCNLCVCVYAENIFGLQEQSNQITEQLNESNNKLQVVQEQLSKDMQQLQEIDQQIIQVEEQMNNVNSRVKEVEQQIIENEEKLQNVQKQLDDMQDVLNARLIAIYKTPKLQNLQILLKSKNISEFFANYDALKRLLEYDKNLLETVKTQKQEIDTTKQFLIEKKKEVIQDKQSQQKKAQILENTKTMREYYISKLTAEEQELQAQIDEYNLQVATIEAEIRLLALNSISEDYIGGAMTWPIPGYTRITSPFGMRVHPITGAYKLHSGMDVGAPMGASFVAAANGIVAKATFNTSYGNMVIIDHGGGVQTLYAHGSEIVVQVGQTVSTGDEVLKVGSTGYSTGPHAHFEIRIDGQTINPVNYLVQPDLIQNSLKTEEKVEQEDTN